MVEMVDGSDKSITFKIINKSELWVTWNTSYSQQSQPCCWWG